MDGVQLGSRHSCSTPDRSGSPPPTPWPGCGRVSGLAPDAVAAVLGADPVGEWAARWRRARPHRTDGGDAAVGTSGRRASPPRRDLARRVRVHEAGGGDVDELAYAGARGALPADAHRRRARRGCRRSPARVPLRRRLDQFLTTAKLRAARRTASRRHRQRRRRHAAATACRDVTLATARYDTWVNVLRNTVACFARDRGCRRRDRAASRRADRRRGIVDRSTPRS